jgi:hypothetical protein
LLVGRAPTTQAPTLLLLFCARLRVVKWLGPWATGAVDARQQLDASLGPFEDRLALPEQRDAALITSEGVAEADLSLFQLANDFL